MTGIIRRLIADDHPVVRDGLRGIFQLGVNNRAAAVAAGFERGLLPRP